MATTVSWTHAVFSSESDVRDALDRLAEAGIGADDIELRSSIPLGHDVLPAGLGLRSRVPAMAVLGGLLGGTGAFLLNSFASLAYPLPTGGMPLVALPPSAVITFEGLALGAILCTVGTVLYECRLPARSKPQGLLDEHLAAGGIIVAVRSGEALSAEWASKAIITEDRVSADG
jgi:hypothetical protein